MCSGWWLTGPLKGSVTFINVKWMFADEIMSFPSEFVFDCTIETYFFFLKLIWNNMFCEKRCTLNWYHGIEMILLESMQFLLILHISKWFPYTYFTTYSLCWPTESCLVWKWLLCELCFIHHYTISNVQFLPTKFHQNSNTSLILKCLWYSDPYSRYGNGAVELPNLKPPLMQVKKNVTNFFIFFTITVKARSHQGW